MKKIRVKRLSVKIILTLFAILMALMFVTFLITVILRSTGFSFRDLIDRREEESWIGFVFNFAMLIMGISCVLSFAYILKKTIVARIFKLNSAATEVMKGNFEVVTEVKGYDELSRLTETFNKMTKELKANEYLSKDFVRSVSHEFKTPLSSVKAYAELISSEAEKDAPDKKALLEYADIIIEESDRLALMSKSILQLSLLDSTTIIKKDDTFCPAEQIRSIMRLTHKKWSEKNIEIELDLQEFTVTNNEQLLYQVWQNLLSNAIKFTGENGKIKIALKKTENGFYFEITDNGTGIKEEDKQQIFRQFFVADKSRNTEGTGLGLSIVKKITEKLGGKISFESTEGQGSSFKIEL